MRKLYAFFLFLVCCQYGIAQKENEIKLTTSKSYGDVIDMWPKPTSAEDTISIDWGDGKRVKYSIDPQASDYMSKVSGKITGDTIRIYGQLTKFDCTKSDLTSFSIKGQSNLQKLLINDNKLTSENLNLAEAPNLEIIDIANNSLTVLDLRSFEKLQIFTANDNKELGTVLFKDGSNALSQISMSGCDISHFYPISLPKLTALNLANNSLMDIAIEENYPSLSSLDISGNYLNEIDITKCSKLYSFNCANNKFTEIDNTHCPELVTLSCSNNQIKTLNLVHNPKLTNLGCDNNLLTKLDVSVLPSLTRLYCSGNKLTTLNLSKNDYLKTIECEGNQLEVLDFTNNFRLSRINCRNNHNMTPCSINYMFSTLPALDRDVYSPNLLIEGCNAETADASDVTSEEYKWKTDIKCDGTAKCDSVTITIMPAENGTYALEQPLKYGQNYQPITHKAMAGTPVKVIAVPEKNFAYQSITVNGVEIEDSIFCPQKASTVKANFKSTIVPYITVNVATNTTMSFALAATEENTDVAIDWGDGVNVAYTIGQKWTRIDGSSKGTTVKVIGKVSYANFESFPGMDVWDNQLTGIDISHNDSLIWLSTYMNEINKLDVSNCPKLEYLDCSYSELDTLDVTKNPLLKELYCYGNSLSSLDVTKNPYLTLLKAKGNFLKVLDLSSNPLLQVLDVQNNELKNIDVKAMKDLTELYVNNNKLEQIEVSKNTLLKQLNVSNNALSIIDLSKNTLLTRFNCNGNKLSTLDLSNQPSLCYMDCGSNGMTACALNDLYYSLPQYPTLNEPLKGYTLLVKGAEGSLNDADHAESLIAKGKGWVINYEGDGSGCNEAYITINKPENGSIKVLNGKDEVKSGNKVTKSTVLVIKDMPDKGYQLSNIKANGEIVEKNQFTVEKATDIVATFTVASGITQEKAAVTVIGEKGYIQINAIEQARCTIYTLDGKQLYSNLVSGLQTIPASVGNYIVVIEYNGKTSNIISVK